jgi:hypothetical protein
MPKPPEVTLEQGDKPKETHPEPVSDPQRPALWEQRDGAEGKPKAADAVHPGEGRFDGDPVAFAIEGKHPPGTAHKYEGPSAPDVIHFVLEAVGAAGETGASKLAYGAGVLALPVEAYALAKQIVDANSPEAKAAWTASHSDYNRQYGEEFHTFTKLWDDSHDVGKFLKKLGDMPITSEASRDARATLVSLALPTNRGSFEKLGGYLDKLTAVRDAADRQNKRGIDTPGIIQQIREGQPPRL